MGDSIIIPLVGPDERDLACEKVRIAPKGYVVRIGPMKRSLLQNSKLHALCVDCERSAFQHAGRARKAWEWKWFFTCGHAVATGKPGELVLGLEGERLMLRPATSEMGVAELSGVLEYAIAFCAEKGIQLRDDHAA